MSPRPIRMKHLLLAGALVALLSGCGASNGTGDSPAGTGIKGRTVFHPTCPVEQLDSPCLDAGIAARIKVLSAIDSSTVAETTSAADGSFSLDLPAGSYLVIAEAAQELPTVQTQQISVTVTPDHINEIVIAFDSGLRDRGASPASDKDGPSCRDGGLGRPGQPKPVARCVRLVPGGPSRTTFSLPATKSHLGGGELCCLRSDQCERCPPRWRVTVRRFSASLDCPPTCGVLRKYFRASRPRSSVDRAAAS